MVVNRIGGVTTDQGLRARATLDLNTYEPDIERSDAARAAINIERDQFHGAWFHRVTPRLTGGRGQLFNWSCWNSLVPGPGGLA